MATPGSGISQEGNLSAVGHVGDEVVEGVLIAGHFEANIEALGHAEFSLDIGNLFVADIDDASGAKSFGEFQPLWVEVGDDDVTGTGVF